jgi:amino acid adenylation domain-containing protein
VQVVHPAAPIRLAVTDLGGLRPEARERELSRLVTEEAHLPFDLAAGPLLRTTAVRLGDEETAVLFTLHHVVSDGWSMGVLVRELSALYAAFAEGREPELAPLPVQYADYAAWQRAWLQGEVLERQLAYWRGRLQGAPPRLDLPTDRPRPAFTGGRGAREGVAIPAETARQLRALARREGATVFMVLLAAWQALLARYTGESDVVVGTPIAGRTQTAVEGLIGLFVNTLALRTDLSGNPSFREAVRRVREATLGAYAHQDLPFEKLVEELGVERSLGHTPLFQVMFAYGERERVQAEIGTLRMEPLAPASEVVRFDLSLQLAGAGDAMGGVLTYRTALFDPATIRRLLGDFGRLLGALAADPESGIARAQLLAGAERQRVLHDWNHTAAEFPRERCVHELFAAQAARTPAAVAVSAGSVRLTYAELDGWANRLARHLRGVGVGPDARVGVCLERGVELVVAILAILKAGGAYLPLDPTHPPERLLAVLDDAGAHVAVSTSPAAAKLAAYAGAIVRLDADRERIEREDAAPPEVSVSPRSLAYLIPTSGSTGRPKGVMVEHRSVVNLHAALGRAIYAHRGAAAPPRVSVNGPVTFDTSVKQVVQLLGGATLCIVPEAARYDANALGAWLREQAVEVLDCTPAQLGPLLAEGLLEKAGPALTDLLVAGEAIGPALWATLASLEGRRAWNLYGPTECTVDATVRRVSGARPLLGGPISNARLYVVDEGGAPVPPGVAGELYVGGAGVARGYAGRPALTAERFVPDPFSGERGARLYRTGDRVRWTAQGEVEYLGRIDFQLKVRGFRIEPGEIEAVLAAHPAVRQAVAVAREDRPGERRLVAYAVAGEGSPSPADLLRHLREWLPGYLVPSAVVVMDALPRTSGGKVDRRALPAPAVSLEGRRLKPQTELEARLAAVWQELLGVEEVGAEDNFFDLGGHSLLLIRLQARLAEELGREVPVVELFQYPTVRSLAARLQGAADGGAVDEGEERGGARQAALARRMEARRRRDG